MPAIETDRSTMHLTQALLASRGWKLGLFVFCILGMNFSGTWIAAQLDLQIWPQHGDVIELVIVSMVVAFVIAMATPFVPGIEIGLALMLLLGPGGIVMVYLCTQLSLALSFLLGTTIRPRYLSSICRWLQFEQASQLLTELDRTPPELRMWRLARRSNSRWVSLLERYRGPALALILNLPGNAVLGGAGGIAMVAGMSHACSFPRFLALMAISTMPVPAFLFATGAV